MRSDTIKLGDARAPHRSLLRATGLRDGDFNKPFIAICNSHVDIIPGHVHLDKVGQYVKQCVRGAGGVPFVFNTIGVDDGIAMGHAGMKYSLPSREIIADSVETMLAGALLRRHDLHPQLRQDRARHVDGRRALQYPHDFRQRRADGGRPTADGKTIDLIDVFVAAAAKQDGKLSAADLLALEQAGCPTCGSCSGMFTANSMNCLCEALGMALPTNGTLLATSADRKRLFQHAAERIVAMVLEFDRLGPGHGLLPREIVTARLDRQLDGPRHGHGRQHQHGAAHAGHRPRGGRRLTTSSGSTNSSRQTPNVCRVAPSSNYHVENVHNAGGVHTILGSVQRGRPGLLHLDCSHGQRQDAGREHRRLRRPRRHRRRRGPGVGGRPRRRPAHEPRA